MPAAMARYGQRPSSVSSRIESPTPPEWLGLFVYAAPEPGRMAQRVAIARLVFATVSANAISRPLTSAPVSALVFRLR